MGTVPLRDCPRHPISPDDTGMKGENMATQSPGVYMNEHDNTQYENPKSTTGTIVAVVGYAKKGLIAEPTLITSWSGFTSTFGKPVDGYYSGLAVKNILSAGGAVLFVRVADSSASPSNCIIKNPIAGTLGSIKFARETDVLVGTKGYQNGKIYCYGDGVQCLVRMAEEGRL